MVALLVVGLLLLMAGATRPASASPLQEFNFVPGSVPATTVVCQAQGEGCGYDRAPFMYDAPSHVALDDDVEMTAAEAAMAGMKHGRAKAGVSVGHVYDAARDLVAPTSVADDVALGLRGSGDVGGVANRDWIAAGLADEGPFVQRFYQAMYRSTSNGGRIRFNLDGLDLDRALSTNRFSDPFDVGATNWELQQILANPQFRGATDFYLDGQILSADRVAALGLGG